MFTYFIAGVVSGICMASFFLGKELYRISKKNYIQKNEIERLTVLHYKIKEALNQQHHTIS